MVICRNCGSILHDTGVDLRTCWCSVCGSGDLWRPAQRQAEDRSHDGLIGLVAGGTVGGVLGGPVGAVVGGLIGAFFGVSRSKPQQ